MEEKLRGKVALPQYPLFECYDIATLRNPMKSVPRAFVPPIALDRGRKIPIYRQVYDWFRRAIIAGQLKPGQRVPSTRTLAAELNISRIPLLNAYEQLLAEGYFETFIGAGT